MKWFSFALLLLLLYPAKRSDACTVFYICRDGRVFGGSNEDWRDADTRMWFYPSAEEHHGWVKFGFAGGFPQAGMNDSGIFWDGTANPRQDMPFSEANKEKLSIPLMQKVMEECSTITEVNGVCGDYYCDDQYRGQYLVGGTEGCSVIVDGDHLHHNDHSFQVLTNFRISNPELGGYPCWRYELSSEMLDSCILPTPELIVTILSATHQEGKYPTQYSIIFDPMNGIVYLFYYHNFQEYLPLNLDEYLMGDTASYAIPPLFSRLELLYPAQGADIQDDSVVLKWKGLPGSSYEVMVSDEKGAMVYRASTDAIAGKPLYRTIHYTGLLIPFLLLVINTKNRMLALLAACFLFCNCCKKEEVSAPIDPSIEFTYEAAGLETGKTYHWKVIATPGGSSFQTESVSRSFTCNAS
ncbi:MAG: hypothetical protein V2I47_06435 [Bacteroidales bacterium]|jgi:choloylglycine hydrolase|nr:hypothetical protein [Bacteroidales bacterium]